MGADDPRLPRHLATTKRHALGHRLLYRSTSACCTQINIKHSLSPDLFLIILDKQNYANKHADDGAYYYVWGGGGKYPPHDPELSPWIPARPWPAEEGLVIVKEALYAMGVPVAYLQLDDW